MGTLWIEAQWAFYGLSYVAVALLFLFGAKQIYSWLTPYSLKQELSDADNAAAGVVLGGYLLGVICVICGTLAGSGFDVTAPDLATEIPLLLFYGAMGVGLLMVSGILNNKLILKTVSNNQQIVESNNVSIGVIAAAIYISTGFIIAGGIHGSLDPVSVLVAHVMGQSAFVLFSVIYQWKSRYDETREIGEKQNLAAGFSFGGTLIAYSLILMKAVSATDVVEWEYRLRHFGYYAVLGGVFLIVLHMINDRVILPEVRLSDEIIDDQNLNAGLLDAATVIGAAAILVFCL